MNKVNIKKDGIHFNCPHCDQSVFIRHSEWLRVTLNYVKTMTGQCKSCMCFYTIEKAEEIAANKS